MAIHASKAFKKHFHLDHESIKIPEKEVSPPHGYYGDKGLTIKLIREKMQDVTEKNSLKTKNFDDRHYFVLTFTFPITSKKWDSIYENLNARLIHIYNEKTVKVAVYELDKFLESLVKNRKYVKDVTDKSGEKIISDKLEIAISKNRLTSVAIEAVDLSGLKSPEIMREKLKKMLDDGEEIYLGYHDAQKALFRGKLTPSTIRSIAENLETVTSIDEIPKIRLTYDSQAEIEKYIPVSTENEDMSNLPVVCLADSGINKNHNRLKTHIQETYDYTTSDGNSSANYCSDDTGHGSMVSSIAIYRNEFDTGKAKANVIMLKIFKEDKLVLENRFKEEMDLLKDIITRFKTKSRVFNFSFSSEDKIKSWTHSLDDIAYENDVTLVVAAGNIDGNDIIHSLNGGENYPNYIFNHPINFPGDCNNVITVGSFTAKHSDLCPNNHPSPFTRSGIHNENLKPDVLDEGGNLQIVKNGRGQVIGLDPYGLGVRGASNNGSNSEERTGTSISCPSVSCIVSNIYLRYPTSNPYLAKALLLSSADRLDLHRMKPENSDALQGFGTPNEMIATQSLLRRTCYLLQGVFEYSKPKVFHKYAFHFPKTADRLTITLSVGKPSQSDAYLKYRFIRGGSSSYYRPQNNRSYIGDRSSKVFSTHKQIYEVKRGGKAEWTIEIIPEIKDIPMKNNSLKYGCVIVVESSKNKDVYTEISKKHVQESSPIIEKEKERLIVPSSFTR